MGLARWFWRAEIWEVQTPDSFVAICAVLLGKVCIQPSAGMSPDTTEAHSYTLAPANLSILLHGVSTHTHKHTMLLAFPACIQYVLSRPSRPIRHANIYKLQAYANGCIPQRFRSLIESQVMRRAVAGWQSSKLCPAQKMVTEHVSQVTRTCLRCELMDGRLKMYEFHGESW